MSRPDPLTVNVVPSNVALPGSPTEPISRLNQPRGNATGGPAAISNRPLGENVNRWPAASYASICTRAIVLTGPGFAHTQLDAVRGSDAQPAIGVNVRPSVVDDRMRYDAIVASFA